MKKKGIALTDAELSEEYMIPQKLTKDQKSAADNQLTEALKNSRAGMSEETVVGLKLYQLKFQMEDYLKQGIDNIL